jgi:hypothetical protein
MPNVSKRIAFLGRVCDTRDRHIQAGERAQLLPIDGISNSNHFLSHEYRMMKHKLMSEEMERLEFPSV